MHATASTESVCHTGGRCAFVNHRGERSEMPALMHELMRAVEGGGNSIDLGVRPAD